MLDDTAQPVLLQKLFELLEAHRGYSGKSGHIGGMLVWCWGDIQPCWFRQLDLSFRPYLTQKGCLRTLSAYYFLPPTLLKEPRSRTILYDICRPEYREKQKL